MLDSTKEQRVIIRAHVKHILGNPLAHPFTLGKLFSQKILNRELRKEWNPNGLDAIHILPGFDSQNDIIDFGVKCHIKRPELTKTPHQQYLAHFDEKLFQEPSVTLYCYLACLLPAYAAHPMPLSCALEGGFHPATARLARALCSCICLGVGDRCAALHQLLGCQLRSNILLRLRIVSSIRQKNMQ